MPALSVLLQPERVIEVDGTDREQVLRALAEAVDDPGCEVEALVTALRDREALSSTGFGSGVAMPHARLATTRKFHVVLARAHQGVAFDAIDGEPVRLFMLVVGPEQERGAYAKLMGRAAKFLKAEADSLLGAADLPSAVTAALTHY